MPTGNGARTLFVVPIAHSREDMGALGRQLGVSEAYVRRARFRWKEIDRRVRALSRAYPGLKVYQDGLPDAGPDMVQRILESVQSPNYDLLRWLAARGAELVGTESPDLLRQEYAYLQAVLTAPDEVGKSRARRAYADAASSLLSQRDEYIARRIVETLPPDGTGLLLIGLTHQVAGHLPADVLVRELPGASQTAAAPESGTD